MRTLILFVIFLPVLAAADAKLGEAEHACAQDIRACPEYDRLKKVKEVKDQRDQESEDARDLQREQQKQAEYEAERNKEDRIAAELKRRCGSDFMRLQVGMPWARARQCSGTFAMTGQSGGASIYESSTAIVWVVGGKVARWLAK